MPDPTLANYLVDTTKTFSQITGTYATLADLGVDYIFRGFDVYSSFDTEVVIKFKNSSGDRELIIPPNWGIPLPRFRCNDVIEIKHTGAAPTKGFLKMLNWRAE